MIRKAAKKSMTVEQAVDELAHDPEYLAKREQFQAQHQREVTQNHIDVAPVLRELNENGFVYDSIHSLRHSGVAYRAAVPILLKWLPKVHNYDIKQEIARTLSVPWAKPEAAPAMIREFLTAEPSQDSYKWALGNGLAIVADDSVADDVIKLATDPAHGRARQMLAIALGNMREPRVLKVLLGLLQDPQIQGHAIIGLRKLGSATARPYVEPFLEHKEAWIRKEAKKAIAKFDRAVLQKTNKLASRKVQ